MWLGWCWSYKGVDILNRTHVTQCLNTHAFCVHSYVLYLFNVQLNQFCNASYVVYLPIRLLDCFITEVLHYTRQNNGQSRIKKFNSYISTTFFLSEVTVQDARWSPTIDMCVNTPNIHVMLSVYPSTLFICAAKGMDSLSIPSYTSTAVWWLHVFL